MGVVTVEQHIITEFNGAMQKEEKIMAITKNIMNLMKQTGHLTSQAPQNHSI
jgi:hypothetical protein